MSDQVLIPGSSVPAIKPECVTCPVTTFARGGEDYWRGDLRVHLTAHGHMDEALRLLSDPGALDRGAVRDAILAAKRALT